MVAAKDMFMAPLARARLAGGGYNADTTLNGTTVDKNDVSHKQRIQVNEGQPAYMAQVDQILAEADAYSLTLNGGNHENPNSSLVQSRRAYNRKHFVQPILDGMLKTKAGAKNAAEWTARMDDACTTEGKAVGDAIEKALADSNTTTLGNVFNQPVILTALIIEQFQDMQALQSMPLYSWRAWPMARK
jgi:hypothetical protein